MLLLKEAIGTCYFCRFPGSLGLARKVLIGGVIRRCMVAHGGFVGPGVVGGGGEGLSFECRVKKIPRIKQLCNSTVPRDKKSWKIPLLIIIAL